MTRKKQHEASLVEIPGAAARSELEEFAAELTEAAFPVALQYHTGTDWLDRKLELWNAMTRTVNAWQQAALAPLSE